MNHENKSDPEESRQEEPTVDEVIEESKIGEAPKEKCYNKKYL